MSHHLADYVQRVVAHNAGAVSQVAAAVARTGQADGLVYSAGAGHSLASVMETFYRPGGLAFVRPLWDTSVSILRGARDSSQAERAAGSGTDLLSRVSLTEVDTVVVFSNSGVNPYPVEIAQGARAAGATVVALTSVASSAAAPPRAGQRLGEVAHIVLDTLVPQGDVSWPVEHPETVSLSTLANVVLWSEVLRAVFEAWPEAPLWRSSNVSGNDDAIEQVAARYAARIPEL